MLVDIVPDTTKIGARTPGEGEEAAGEQQSSSKAVISCSVEGGTGGALKELRSQRFVTDCINEMPTC